MRLRGQGMFFAWSTVVVLVLVSFFLTFFNRSVSYHGGSGIVIASATMLKHGLLPYKEFYCPTPIFHLWWTYALLEIFHNHMIVLRIFAVAERLLSGVLMFAFLRRLFSPSVSCIAAITTVIFSSLEQADCIDVYSQQALFLSLFGILAVSYALDDKRSRKAIIMLGALAGLITSLILFTKQTIGLGVTVAVPVAAFCCLFRLRGLPSARNFLFSYVGGWLAMTGLFTAWLAENGIAWTFFNQAFIEGPKAKSGFITRFITGQTRPWIFTSLGILLLCLIAPKLMRAASRTAPVVEERQSKQLLIVLAMGLLAIGSAAMMINLQSGACALLVERLQLIGIVFQKSMMPCTFYALALCCLTFALLLRKKDLSWREAQYGLFAIIAFTNAVTVSASWAFYEVMLTPGLALIIACLIEGLPRLGTILFRIAWVAMISCVVMGRIAHPYTWEGFEESPANSAIRQPALPELAGYYLPDDMASFLEGAVKTIHESSTKDDPIFIFPDGALLYALADRRPSTSSLSLNMDTTPDSLITEDAKRLLEKKPAVLVYYQIPEAQLKYSESCFRGGKESATRYLMAVCESLAKEYHQAGTYKIGQTTLRVFTRTKDNH